MSKYKAGDKFVVEIDKALSDANSPFIEGELYRIKGFKSLVFDEFGLDELEKCFPAPTTTEYDEGYVDGKEKGVDEAWEITKKLFEYSSELYEIFGFNEMNQYVSINYVLDIFTPQEAKAKIEAWEKSKEEIKVGDVCESKVDDEVYRAVCLKIENDEGVFLYDDASVSCGLESLSDWTKTGRHIDIQSVLEQIGGKE